MSGAALQANQNNPVTVSARCWDRVSMEAVGDAFRYTLSVGALSEIDAAIGFCRRNGLTSETVEQEDFRIPSFSVDVESLHQQLDAGRGFVVIGGLDTSKYSDDEAGIIAWGLGNYLGRPVRQGLNTDRRMFTVTDTGGKNTDPTRIGASSKRSAMHSDNGCLERRPPCYIGLLCSRTAVKGGESMLISAETVHGVVERERPDLLPLFYETWDFRPPVLHTWPDGPKTIRKPIFERDSGELRIHYARVMIEPGMELAGTPLTDRQREALDYFDSVLDRRDLYFSFVLRQGEFLVTNNLVNLHGREAFATDSAGGRVLKRIWMWRRHVGAGDNPVALDAAEMR